MNIIPAIDETEIMTDYHYLHQHGEVGFHEHETTAYLARRLDDMHIAYEHFNGMTGLIATLGAGSPVIALRADIDALKQTYQNKLQVVHSCGHDGHMSLALSVGRYFRAHPHGLHGTLKLVFQPSEETGEGAEAVLKTGQLGHIDYFYGVHVRPQQEVAFGQCEAIIPHGSTQTITGTITGQTFHAGMPEQGHNVIEAFTRLNEKIMAIDLDTNVPYSAKATIFKAGDSTNIIPGTGTFALDLRAQTNDTMADLTKIVDQIIADVQDDHFSIRTNKTGFSPAAIPSKNAIGYMSQAITAVLGQRGLVDSVPSAGGDDFHFYAYSHPEIQSTMLGLGCDLTPGLHVPSMTFKTDALFYGAKILIDVISRTA